MSNSSSTNSGKFQQYANKIILVGLGILFLFQFVTFVRLLFFRKSVWIAGDFMIDIFGHISLKDIVLNLITLLILFMLVEFWRKHKLIVAAYASFGLRTAVGGGVWRYFVSTHDNVGQNLQVFNQFPLLLVVIISSALTCLATLLALVAFAQGETLQALLEDFLSLWGLPT